MAQPLKYKQVRMEYACQGFLIPNNPFTNIGEETAQCNYRGKQPKHLWKPSSYDFSTKTPALDHPPWRSVTRPGTAVMAIRSKSSSHEGLQLPSVSQVFWGSLWTLDAGSISLPKGGR